VRYFYYDGDRIIVEREGNSWVVRYLLGLRSCGHVVSGQIRVYHADRLGSVRWVTDGNGNLVASYVYEGFGKVVGQEGSETVPYRFCGLWGYRNDGDAGLLHVGARYYEVETGRWVQKDPIVINGSINPQKQDLYTYVLNDPINIVDPDGRIIVGIIAGFIIGASIEIIAQIVEDKIKGRSVDIDWTQVVIEGGIGAISGGIGGYIGGSIGRNIGKRAAYQIVNIRFGIVEKIIEYPNIPGQKIGESIGSTIVAGITQGVKRAYID